MDPGEEVVEPARRVRASRGPRDRVGRQRLGRHRSPFSDGPHAVPVRSTHGSTRHGQGSLLNLGLDTTNRGAYSPLIRWLTPLGEVSGVPRQKEQRMNATPNRRHRRTLAGLVVAFLLAVSTASLGSPAARALTLVVPTGPRPAADHLRRGRRRPRDRRVRSGARRSPGRGARGPRPGRPADAARAAGARRRPGRLDGGRRRQRRGRGRLPGRADRAARHRLIRRDGRRPLPRAAGLHRARA